ncbi:hypothetical protein L596_013349 [Steinernema carpocapsae]|uniref:Metalloendopeptidase n=1 Tax=Steinernema carpocapsae TaxID=34508 RepID=A0A4U5P024_STECR|nr:hypothetical protein L596_013349 [Steinernema carpocapsae]
MIPVNLSVEIPHLSIAELNRNLSEYLHQGDIIANKEHLETSQDIKRAKRNTINALNDTGLVWETNKPIPYTIDSNIENGDAKGTTLIKFINGGGCYSSVGKQYRTSSQTVSIGGGCSFFGIAAHEIGHALGMWHAQSRVDRDDYVNVVSSNVYPNLMYNYVKETAATNYNHKVRYDYGSIMHYEPSERHF